MKYIRIIFSSIVTLFIIIGLCAIALYLFGIKPYIVVSGSMEPTIKTGGVVFINTNYDVNDVIVSKEIPLEKINRGDDLVYLGEKDDYKGKIITHRVVDIKGTSGNYRFTTKGIANPDNDPEVEGKQVYGIVVKKLVILSFFSHILNNSYGLYFLIILPIAFLIFLEILDKIKEVENECEG